MRRVARLLTVMLLLWLPATAAHADPAGPTHYRSVLTSTVEVDGVTASIYGGDAFLVLEVAPGSGHEVVVYGYEHSDQVVDAFLRISQDGTVEVNRRSPARWKNLDRYASVELPDSVDPNAPPDWEVVGSGGRYAWHDHRIHWMSSALPPTIDAGGGVQVVPTLMDWRVPIEVDGTPMELAGTLTWEPAPTPVPWVVVAVLLVGAVGLLARRGGTLPWLAVVATAFGALVVGIGGSIGAPPGVGIALPAILLPAAGLAVAAVARPRRGEDRPWLLVASGVPLVAWTALQFGAMIRPIVPSDVPVLAIRVVVVAAVAVALGLLAAAVADLFGGSLEDLAAVADADAGD